jgi:protein O-GlcNAc transferase
VDPFSLFMIDFSMEDKLLISAKWAENEKQKAYDQMKRNGVHYFEPFQHQLISLNLHASNLGIFKIRVGYVSFDFADHPLAHLLNSLFELHNREIFQVVGFSLRPDDGSEWRKNIEGSCNEFYQIPPNAGALELAQFIKSKNIHVLFNLNGWTSGARQDVFALRPSPIQIQFMGFCGTTGADYIDYIITDEVASPVPVLNQYYSEKAIYMPDSYFLNDYM